jgi:hypothetical protein
VSNIQVTHNKAKPLPNPMYLYLHVKFIIMICNTFARTKKLTGFCVLSLNHEETNITVFCSFYNSVSLCNHLTGLWNELNSERIALPKWQF